MNKLKLKELLTERFLSFNEDYQTSTTFRITEINDKTFRILLVISGRPLQKIKLNYETLVKVNFNSEGSVNIYFMRDLIEIIEYVGDYFDCHIIFKSDTHTRDFILIKK